jgi:hypothetical protein
MDYLEVLPVLGNELLCITSFSIQTDFEEEEPEENQNFPAT